jgi:ectoine hydroxylase-related dioxygenase (phytanoyl-CoA dioxygenase family)
LEKKQEFMTMQSLHQFLEWYICNVASECGDLFFTKGGQDDLAITPEVGKMVLFPSFLKHGVQTNKSNQNRISLAFNLFPFPLPSEEW